MDFVCTITRIMQYITVLFASCCTILPPSEIMETNLKLEQVDRFQSNVEQSLTTQVTVMNSDRNEKVNSWCFHLSWSL